MSKRAKCETCGGTNIVDIPPGCLMCGAPNCCVDCCKPHTPEHLIADDRIAVLTRALEWYADRNNSHKIDGGATARAVLAGRTPREVGESRPIATRKQESP